MAPTDSSRDPFREFAERGLSVVEQHGTDIALLKQAIVTRTQAEEKCESAQHESWQKMEARMSTVEAASAKTADSLTRFIEAHDKKSGGNVQLWGYILALIGTLGMAWATYTASVAKSDMPAMLTKAVAEGLKAAGH